MFIEDRLSKTILTLSHTNFHSAFYLLPELQRKGMTILYAFCRYADDIIDGELFSNGLQKDPRHRLDKLEKELEACYHGYYLTSLMKELSWVIEFFSIPINLFKEFLDGVRMDIDKKSYATFMELKGYCHRVASVVGLLSLHIFGCHNERTIPYAIDLGIALQLTNIVRDVRKDYEIGRVYLPQEDLDKFSVQIEDIASDKVTDTYYSMMEFQYNRNLTYYNSAHALFPHEFKKKLLFPIVLNRIYFNLLTKIRHSHYIKTSSTSLSTSLKLTIAIVEYLKLLRS